MRDDFPAAVKVALAKRVGFVCSNPDCRAPTSGPQDDPTKAVSIGAAAHITAASPDGPRYDASLTPEQRQDISNGIWLCQNCAKLIDSDLQRFTIALFRGWKEVAEDRARRTLGKPETGSEAGAEVSRLRIELPAPRNRIGTAGTGTFNPGWNVKARLIVEGDKPLDVVELGLAEEGVGEWTIIERFLEGSGRRVDFPIQPRQTTEFWIRAQSPQVLAIKPKTVGRLTLWVRDHTQREGERHEYVVEPLPEIA